MYTAVKDGKCIDTSMGLTPLGTIFINIKIRDTDRE